MDVREVSAVVTGGGSGLGAAVTGLLAEAGARVVIADIDAAEGASAARRTGASFARTDVADPDSVIAAVDLAASMAPLRILVNCAGIARAQRMIGRDGDYASAHDLDMFRKVIEVNLIGTFNSMRIAATAMARTEALEDGQRGSIVNTSSVAAFEGQIGQVAYSASKGGIVGLTLPAARDLAAAGIRVNTIAPGLMETPIYGHGAEAERWKASLSSGVLFPRRLGRPEEFARLCLHVLTNPYMNGETVRIDGGVRLPAK